MTNANKNIRAGNFFIDYLLVFILTYIFDSLTQHYLDLRLALMFFYFAYYLILESIFGKTIGKIITKSVVANQSGTKPNFLQIFVRTLLRLVPFDLLSYLFGSDRGIHDILSKTKVIMTE
ncbi:RDD family protein [Carboxylicivirga caseinilyticus]|uniref:RDD family protein n=1 Tax=Carboxylicivirga caseinilyticus TaxID=3417572 RepID=UPI003D346F31|nr:RDD family protein [Marinilabiliaceae bacterium A049]